MNTKHIFIMNPQSGNGQAIKNFLSIIQKEAEQSGLQYEIHQTQYSGDGERYVKMCCQAEVTATLRFYAVGGDGTLHEVVNGAFGFDHAEVAFIPAGMGNDFVRMFSSPKNFRDIRKQLSGTSRQIDLLRYNDRYSVNTLNIGLDAAVARKAAEFKSKTFLKSSQAYLAGIAAVLGRNQGYQMTVTLENGREQNSLFTLTAIGNGAYCGGGFKALPKAKLDDGVLDVIIVNKINRRTLMSLLPKYRKGSHLEMPGIEQIIHYEQCKSLEIKPVNSFEVCADGELTEVSGLRIEILPKAIRFSVPEGSSLDK